MRGVVLVMAVRVKSPFDHGDGIGPDARAAERGIDIGIAFGKDAVADNAAALTDIDLTRHVAVLRPEIPMPAILPGIPPERLGNLLVVLEQPEEPNVVREVALVNLATTLHGGGRPFPALFGKVERFTGNAGIRVNVVAVQLKAAIGQRIDLHDMPECGGTAGAHIVQNKLVIVAAEARRLRDGYAIRGSFVT